MMNGDEAIDAEDPMAILSEVIERLISMCNDRGHELLAVQSVCGYLVAKQCDQTSDPLASVQETVALLSGTGVALADISRKTGRLRHHGTQGATNALERIAAIAERQVRSLQEDRQPASGSLARV